MSQSFLTKAMGKIAADEKSVVDTQPKPETTETSNKPKTKVPTNKAKLAYKQQQLQSITNGGMQQNVKA